VVVNQRAYDTTRLAVSMPLLNIVDVGVALMFAAIVFGETPALSATGLTLTGMGVLAMGSGVVNLSRSAERLPDLPRTNPASPPPAFAEPPTTSRSRP
jgi:hypothetical protein